MCACQTGGEALKSQNIQLPMQAAKALLLMWAVHAHEQPKRCIDGECQWGSGSTQLLEIRHCCLEGKHTHNPMTGERGHNTAKQISRAAYKPRAGNAAGREVKQRLQDSLQKIIFIIVKGGKN
eukprot:1069397-Pelagomonas_calceolata.AAC.2